MGRRPTITVADVEEAIASLRSKGLPPHPSNIRKIIGGSVETVRRLYAQVSPEILGGRALGRHPDASNGKAEHFIYEQKAFAELNDKLDKIMFLLRRIHEDKAPEVPIEFIAKAQEMRDKGATAHEVAEHLAVSERWVYKHTVRRHKKGISTAEEVATARKLRAEGLSYQRIADDLDRSKAWVRYHLVQNS